MDIGYAGIAETPTNTREKFAIWWSPDGKRLYWLTCHATLPEANRIMTELRSPELKTSINSENWRAQFVREFGRQATPPPKAQQQEILHQLRRQITGDTDYPRSLDVFKTVFLTEKAQSAQTTQQVISHVANHTLTQGHMLSLIEESTRLECLKKTDVYYLDRSSIKMNEAMLVSKSAPVEIPSATVWWQPLCTLKLDEGVDIRAFFFFQPYTTESMEYLQQPSGFHDTEKELAHLLGPQFRAIFADIAQQHSAYWLVDLILDDLTSVEEMSDAQHGFINQRMTFCAYDALQQMCFYLPSHAKHCKRCTIETIGEQQVLLVSDICQARLARWSRWITTMIYSMAGRFRRPSDETETSGSHECIEIGVIPFKKNHKEKFRHQKQSHRTTLLRYDASYFKPTSGSATASPIQQKRIMSPEEAETFEEAMSNGEVEVDLSGVYVRDYTNVANYNRTLRNKRYYQGTPVPQNPQELRIVKVSGKVGKRQLVSLATWKERERQRHSDDQFHKEKLLTATKFFG